MSEQAVNLSGKNTIVTGAARGIGLATAKALAGRGARVVIADLDGELAEKEAAALGRGAVGMELDVTDRTAFTELLDTVERDLGPLDVLINNAGIMPTAPIHEESDAATTKLIAINLHAVIHGTREAVQRMLPRGSGHIVNVASAAGKIAGARAATYSATKFGVIGFSEGVAAELHGTGVNISCVMPSLAKTELTAGLGSMPGMKWIEPDDVAREIVAALEHPRFSVPVPRAMGFVLNLNQALPYRARAGLGRLMKADSVIAEADRSRRAGYEERALREVTADHEGA